MSKILHACSQKDIELGEFPINHDYILKLYYKSSITCLRWQYFTCAEKDISNVVSIFTELAVYKSVVLTHINEFNPKEM